MSDRVRAPVLVEPGRYELQELPYPGWKTPRSMKVATVPGLTQG
jgi:hypothetical protein